MSTAASETSQILYPVSITMLASVTRTNYNLHKAVKTMSLGQLMWHQWHHNCFLNVRQTWAEAVPLTVALWFKWWTIDCPLCVKLLAPEPWRRLKWNDFSFTAKLDLYLISAKMQSITSYIWYLTSLGVYKHVQLKGSQPQPTGFACSGRIWIALQTSQR